MTIRQRGWQVTPEVVDFFGAGSSWPMLVRRAPVEVPIRSQFSTFVQIGNDSKQPTHRRLGKAERAQQGRPKLHHLFLNRS